jgi:hypothetical protein
MISHKFVWNPFDNCGYSKKLLDGSLVYLFLYMDDMLIVAKNKVEIENLKTLLSNEFKMKDSDATKKILGKNFGETRVQNYYMYLNKNTLKSYCNLFR